MACVGYAIENWEKFNLSKTKKGLKQSSKKIFSFWLIPVFLICFINLAA